MSKVLIIGAGIGGLVLAQILHDNKVPFEIFERDATSTSRKQGWAVALVECVKVLEKVLPKEIADRLHENSVNINTGVHDDVSFVNMSTGERIGRIGGVPDGQPGHVLRVSRQGFRNFLLNSQNLPVSMGKHFTHYEQNADSVTAFFSDGTSVTGSILVGADGVHSHVLDQLIGASHHKLVLSQQVPIAGELNLPPRLYEPLRELSSAVILAGTSNVRLQIGMLHMEDDKSSAFYFYTLTIPRKHPQELSDWVQEASKEEMFEFIMKEVEGLHPTLVEPLRFGGPEAVVKPQIKFLEFVPPAAETWPAGRVTVLGDAAHSMVPFRGSGANTAILDSCDLGLALAKALKANEDLASVIPNYYQLMIPRGQENVLSSRAAAEISGDPVEEWVNLFRRKE